MLDTLDPQTLAGRAGTFDATEIAALAASTDFHTLATAATLLGCRPSAEPPTWLRLELAPGEGIEDLVERLEDLDEDPEVVHLVADRPRAEYVELLLAIAAELPVDTHLLFGDHSIEEIENCQVIAAAGAAGIGPGAGLPSATSIANALKGGLEPWCELRLSADQAPESIAAELIAARELAKTHPDRPLHLSLDDNFFGGFAVARWVAVARLALGDEVVLLIDPVTARPKLAQLTVAAGADGWSRVELTTIAAARPLQERADPATADRLLDELRPR